MDGSSGVPVRRLTCDSCAENGSTPSRDIENVIRIAATWIASVQTRDRDRDVDQQRLAEPVPSRLVST